MQDQYRRLSRTLIVTLVVVFSILIAGGLLIFKNEAPRPAKIVTEAGTTLVSKQQLISGQATYEKYQLADYGTYLGNGAYLGPDYRSSPKCWCKLNFANLSFHKLKHTGFF
ncbi:hypothetical protein [Limosilactobacillus fermentum]|uniref:hypothetical protein n=1 Tax=Limosilactobacillus fermentum TaxID=1613 RepID=UPI0021A78E3E|nr:hypothetical protein [Limosilactobacillus fermentum]